MKVLVTSTDLMMIQFLVPHINDMLKRGYEVELACSEVGGRFHEIKHMISKNIIIYKIQLYRSPFKYKNLYGLKQLKQIINKNNYDLIWTNEPVMGVMTRLAAKKVRKKGTKVIYIAHGFHFYNGAPIKNWILFYPIEKIMSRHMDALVTINKEDYNRAKKYFYTKNIDYIKGIGLDTAKYEKCVIDKKMQREELGIPEDAFVLLSVGELSERKNQILAIKALIGLKDKTNYYLIAGNGRLEEYYRDVVKNAGLEKQFVFLGYQKNIEKLCKVADVFIHPSKREGLGIAPLEAMASGLPLITTYVNGMRDYTKNGVTGCCVFNTNDIKATEAAIQKIKSDTKFRERCGDNNKRIAKKYDIQHSCEDMETIRMRLLRGDY